MTVGIKLGSWGFFLGGGGWGVEGRGSRVGEVGVVVGVEVSVLLPLSVHV